MSDDTERCPACHDTECCGKGAAQKQLDAQVAAMRNEFDLKAEMARMRIQLGNAADLEADLRARLSRYESLDASAPVLDAASVAEFAGLARSVAASHERLRGEAADVERIAKAVEAMVIGGRAWSDEQAIAVKALFAAAKMIRAREWIWVEK